MNPAPRPRAFYLIGPPASGKGTHGRIIGSLPGFFHFSMGQAFRTWQPRDDREIQTLVEAHEITSQGQLASDELAYRIFLDCYSGICSARKFRPHADILILDGIPRRASQAKWLADRVECLKVLLLECPRDVILERVKKRAMAEGRADDTVAVLSTRMDVYYQELEPLLGSFAPSQISRISSHRSPVTVLKHLLEEIECKLEIQCG